MYECSETLNMMYNIGAMEKVANSLWAASTLNKVSSEIFHSRQSRQGRLSPILSHAHILYSSVCEI